MNQAAGGGRAEVERKLINRSLQDEVFRQRLLDDPKGTLEQELERALPEGLEVRVVEESADTTYLVLPRTPSAVGEGGDEISDEALEAVAGGIGRFTDNDDTCGGCDTAAGGLWGACP